MLENRRDPVQKTALRTHRNEFSIVSDRHKRAFRAGSDLGRFAVGCNKALDDQLAQVLVHTKQRKRADEVNVG